MRSRDVNPGDGLRTVRVAAGLTLARAAALAGVDPDHLDRVEAGQQDMPPRWYERVATALAAELVAQRDSVHSPPA